MAKNEALGAFNASKFKDSDLSLIAINDLHLPGHDLKVRPLTGSVATHDVDPLEWSISELYYAGF